MTRDDVIRMAQDAGLLLIDTADGGKAIYTWPKGITEEIELFAALVAAHEREKAGMLPAVVQVPLGYKLVPVEALTRWRDAFAEELAAYDIDPPIHHVLTSHDEIAAMLDAAPEAPAQQR